MTAFVARRSRLALLFPALGCVAIALAATAIATPARAAEQILGNPMREKITVRLDKASLLKLPERTATLVVGNPLIADAVVQPGGIVVITAKSYGMTNIVALDRAGSTLAEYPIQVTGPSDKTVVVYRGIERETYSCAPYCERRITLGDSAAYFTANLTALGTFSAQALGEQKK
jgi:Flp pilus assembly secretin CpaC